MMHRFLGLRPFKVRGGFTLIELLVVIAIIALLIGILLPAIGQARDEAKRVVNISNMSQFGKTLGTYGGDYKEKIYSFNWTKSYVPPKDDTYSDLSNPADDLVAAAYQAVKIIRKRGDRTQSGSKYPGFPKITGWIPHFYYTHLVLQDYLNARLPDRSVVSPFDKFRLESQDRVKEYETGYCPVNPGVSNFTGNLHRWPYSSSYINVIAAYDKSPELARIVMTTWGSVGIPDQKRLRLGGFNLSDVDFTGSKVLTFEAHKWTPRAKMSFFNYDDIIMPLAFFDSSVQIKKIGECNLGWNPNAPKDKLIPGSFEYVGGHAFEPPKRSASGPDLLFPRFLLTRGGIKGIDFGGSEINTGQPKD